MPTEMKLLTNLREICLNCNKFDAIPNCLYVCGKLETLLISDNQIKEIDIDGLRELTKLAIIDLGNNNIASVPPELGNLRNIRSLTLDGNAFRVSEKNVWTFYFCPVFKAEICLCFFTDLKYKILNIKLTVKF